MEIGDDPVHHAEGTAGVEEDVRPAGKGLGTAADLGHAFQRAHRGGAHGDDGSVLGLGLGDGVGRLFGQFHVFPVHLVVADVLAAHGAEGAVAHIERHLGPLEAAPAQGLAQLVGKVQARRGRGHGTGLLLAGVDGLVTAEIFFGVGTLDVGRQGDVPGGGEGVGHVALPAHAHTPVAEGAALEDGHADARAEMQGLAFAHAAPGTDQAVDLGAPGVLTALDGRGGGPHQRQGRQQQEFHLAAGTAAAQQAGLQHAGVVGHQQGAFGQAVRQVAEHVVFQVQGAVAAHGQQARRAPLFRRILGYLLLGQIVGIVLQQKIIFGNENRRHGSFPSLLFGPRGGRNICRRDRAGRCRFPCPSRRGRGSRATGETLVSPCRRGYPFRAVRPSGRQLKEYSQCDAYLSP